MRERFSWKWDRPSGSRSLACRRGAGWRGRFAVPSTRPWVDAMAQTPCVPQQAALPPVASHLAGPQPVEVYVAYGLAQNPDVQAAKHRVRAAAERVPQAASLPDPMLGRHRLSSARADGRRPATVQHERQPETPLARQARHEGCGRRSGDKRRPGPTGGGRTGGRRKGEAGLLRLVLLRASHPHN